MDINDLRGIATVLTAIAFLSVCAWAYSSKRKKQFDDAAQLPFADEEQDPIAKNKVEKDQDD